MAIYNLDNPRISFLYDAFCDLKSAGAFDKYQLINVNTIKMFTFFSEGFLLKNMDDCFKSEIRESYFLKNKDELIEIINVFEKTGINDYEKHALNFERSKYPDATGFTIKGLPCKTYARKCFIQIRDMVTNPEKYVSSNINQETM